MGGLLACGLSGFRRLRYGPLRDLLLEARYVTATGEVAVAGAPVVKNVTGFDLARLLVGSFGTLGFFGDVVLRCRPKPARSQWFRSDDADPFALRQALFAPSSILWDGASTWLLLEGSAQEVAEEQGRVTQRFEEVGAPPQLPAAARLSVAPHQLAAALGRQPAGSFVAEVGVGTVHSSVPVPPVEPNARRLHDAIKHAYDPRGRLNPGRHPW